MDRRLSLAVRLVALLGTAGGLSGCVAYTTAPGYAYRAPGYYYGSPAYRPYYRPYYGGGAYGYGRPYRPYGYYGRPYW